MDYREQVFREKLIEIVSFLNDDKSDNALRGRVGTFADDLMRQSKVESWTDYKAALNDPTYYAVLKLFEAESEKAAARKDIATMRALEILGTSLIARTQDQPGLLPGIDYVDNYIQRYATAVSRHRTGTPSHTSAH